MADHTFHDLKTMTVAQLRELASTIDPEAVKGYTQLRKADIIVGLCTALKIEDHEHHEVVGIDKRTIKNKIKELRVERDAALAAHDHAKLKLMRRRIHHLKRRMHKATV